MGVSGQSHHPGRALPPRKDLCTDWSGDWVDLRAGLDTREFFSIKKMGFRGLITADEKRWTFRF
jgi:hypothetical protein